MANSARLFVMLLTSALWVGAATAQNVPFSDSYEDLPGDIGVPSGAADAAGMSSGEWDQSMGVPAPDTSAPFEGYDEQGFDDVGSEMHGHWMGAGMAPIESTGTWLRRGFWYLETDGVIWNRQWNRDDKLFAAAEQAVTNPDFFNPLPRNINRFTTNRLMYLESTHPGEDGSVRTTLGNFLFRDSRNRDHLAEFTVLGGGDWEQNRRISSEVNFGLFVPFYIAGNNRSFQNSTQQTIDYASDYKSFELNYRVKSRLRRDQLIMDANGQWHRAANSGFEREYLAGLRYMNLGETLDWQAFDIQQDQAGTLGNDGRYRIETDNDMIGLQLGGGLTYQAPRWSIGMSCRGGIFANDATGQTALDFTSDDNNDFNLHLAEDELSFIGEARLLSRFHLTPNVSLRASYELMFMESVAMAPYQATFIPEFAFLNTTGDPFYHGASFGFEGYW